MGKIYTKTGDNKTSDRGYERAKKDELIFEVLGTIDEASSLIDLSMHYFKDEDVKSICLNIIKKLSFICAGLVYKDKYILTAEETLKLESIIDFYEASVGEMNGFIHYFNNLGASILNVSRTVIRRCERRIVSLSEKEDINKEILKFVNRISDLLFILCKYLEVNEND